MTLAEFQATLANEHPPSGLLPGLVGLWWMGKGDWHRAHECVQSAATTDAAWVHAHLHRREGDLGNAGYWYHRAGVTSAQGPFEAEWEAIAAALLAADTPG
ncbi:MAG TPA: hypothetical protein PKD86_15545 [Gemmatales bacterium]|nr:hypothetical protein [Gemmatales bacterium]HMP60759.1 hypothetical protein [Gemmatales bacterium]